ncbi:MAG: UvrD-helicase domain-containing protein, partial [Candidatus Promineifilaceae bacterium]
MKLRKTQERILEYSGGKMAVSAVPGSGKTFILTMLVAKLLSEGALDPQDGQQVLIVTYMNSSVETFRARIRKRLADLGLEPIGFEVRTLHSLALDIVRTSAGSSINESEGLLICDDAEKDNLIALAVTQWIDTNYHLWESLLRDSSPQERVRWQGIVERITRVFIRDAKNHRYSSDDILLKLSQSQSDAAQPISALSQIAEEQELYQIYEIPLLGMLAEIYAIYQLALSRQALRDFDDLIWEACDILGSNDQSAEALRERWPYILEDEAQDSVPL